VCGSPAHILEVVHVEPDCNLGQQQLEIAHDSVRLVLSGPPNCVADRGVAALEMGLFLVLLTRKGQPGGSEEGMAALKVRVKGAPEGTLNTLNTRLTWYTHGERHTHTHIHIYIHVSVYILISVDQG